MCFFVQTNHTRKELLFLMFKEINLRNHSSLHKLFYSLAFIVDNKKDNIYIPELGLCLHFPSQDLTTIKAIKFVKEKLGYKLELKKSQNN